MTWQDFYKFPLMKDEYSGNVIAQPGKIGYRMAWDWISNTHICEYPIGGQRGEQLSDAIVRYVNGESDYRPDYTWTKDEDDPVVICMNGEPCMCIRGWGELCGTGALHLPSSEAAKIQDDFIVFLINKLNGNDTNN